MCDVKLYNLDLYNRLYKSPRYDSKLSSDSEYKYTFIKKYLEGIPKHHMIFDIGSGRGFNTFKLLEEERKVSSVDFSDIIDTYDYDQDLTTYKMEVLEFVDKIKNNNYKFRSIVLCSGMLEHVFPEYINNVLKGLAQVSNKALYGIANHSDRAEGYELHPIRESSEWWVSLMKKYYKKVNLIPTKYEDRFFFIKCSESRKIK